MKNIALVIALAIASLTAAQAQTAPGAEPLHFFVGSGYTYGGDKMASAEYEHGGTVNIRAGSGLAVYGGIDYRVNTSFSFQGSVGMHIDNASAENGSMRFTRYPVEALAYYHPAQNWRFGGGVRYITGAKFTSKGAAYVGNGKFKGDAAGVIEGEYLSDNHWGIKVRYVVEEVKEKNSNYKFDADHIGVYGNYYF